MGKSTKVSLFVGRLDMRKGINGLSGLVVNEMELSILSGDLYVFMNGQRNLMKVLYWTSGD